jgi:hypothetical protein
MHPFSRDKQQPEKFSNLGQGRQRRRMAASIVLGSMEGEGIDARSERRNSTSARSGERIGNVCSSSWWQGPVRGGVQSRGPEKDEPRLTQTEDAGGGAKCGGWEQRRRKRRGRGRIVVAPTMKNAEGVFWNPSGLADERGRERERERERE